MAPVEHVGYLFPMDKPLTIFTRFNSSTGRTEFRQTMHKRGKFGWKPTILRWVECVYDICGNDRNPGMSADLWEETSTGRKAVVFQGAWTHYLPRVRGGVRLPDWIFLDEFPAVDFDTAPLAWMRQVFIPKGAVVLGDKTCPVSHRPSRPNIQPGIPFVGRGDGLDILKFPRAELAVLNRGVHAFADGIETNDGRFQFVTLSRGRFDSDLHYLVKRDGRPWFVTGKYSLVLLINRLHQQGWSGLLMAA
jgi:hypothetical protein